MGSGLRLLPMGGLFCLLITGSIHAARSGLGQSPQVSEAKQCTGIKCNNTCYEQGGGALSSCCPGASRMYDPRTHVCCGGKRVYALTHAHKQACCSDRLYSTMGSLCCSGRVYAQYDANQMRMRCCGQLTFNPLTDTCCDGAVTKGVGDGRCCRTSQGVLAYDPASHLCCQGPGGGKLWSRGNGTGTALYCCGAETFEPSTSICCAGNVRRLRSTSVRPACCGSVAYDAARQHCCGGKVPERRQAAASAMCCGGKMIDGARKICCSGKAQSAERGKTSCCGVKSYSPHRDTCCSGIVNSNLARGRCCGNQAFLPAQATCCEGRLTGVPSVRGEFCCGKTGYEPAVQLCCGNTLVEIRGRDLRCCCGDSGCRTYKTKSHVCCSNGHVMRKRGDRLCCAGKDSQRLYDPKTQTCCSGHVSRTSVRGFCCGSIPYTTRTHLCCRGQLHNRAKGSRCCNTELFNPSAAFCVDGRAGTLIYIPSGRRLCGTTVYDPTTTVCCSGLRVLARVYGHASACCGPRMFNQNTHCCCHGKLHRCPAGKPRCCSTQIFDQLRQTCNVYTREIMDRFQPHLRFCGHVRYDPSQSRCCGNRLYGSDEMCCQRRVFAAPGVKLGRGACCKGQPYNTDTQLCCRGNIWPKTDNCSCCGSRVYDAGAEGCCGGKVLSADYTCCHGNVYWTPGSARDGGSCCGEIGYNRRTQICCGGKIFRRSDRQVTCCGSFPCDPSSRRYICCHGTLTVATSNASTLRCCGKNGYDTERETCCEGRVHRAARGKCCGKNLLSRFDDICCGNEGLYRKNSARKQCCGAGLYNTRKEVCAWNTTIRSRKLSPCGPRFHDSSTQLCCAGEVFAKRPRDRCCLATKFDTRFSSCCDGQVIPRPHSTCVDRESRTRNEKAHSSCCPGEGSAGKRDGLQSEIKRFTAFRTSLCTSDLVFTGKYDSKTSDGALMFVNVSMLKPSNRTSPDWRIIRVKDGRHFRQMGRSFIVAGVASARAIVSQVSARVRSSAKTVRKTKNALRSCQDRRTGPS